MSDKATFSNEENKSVSTWIIYYDSIKTFYFYLDKYLDFSKKENVLV